MYVRLAVFWPGHTQWIRRLLTRTQLQTRRLLTGTQQTRRLLTPCAADSGATVGGRAAPAARQWSPSDP